MHERLGKVASCLYRNYRYNVFPQVKNRRGATFLLRRLQKTAYNFPRQITTEPENLEDLSWDNLFILDGCRADLYEEITGISNQRTTAESSSPGFIKKNFSTGNWKDTVVITANPHYSPEIFNRLTGRDPEDVFEAVFQVYNSHWNGEYSTVLPSPILRQVEVAEKLWPEKRKLVHFMQPHHPFVNSVLDDGGWGIEEENQTVWDHAMQGKYGREQIWKAYKQNLEYILPFVHELAEELTGKTVVTSDHGNFVGENGLYGHPCGLDSKPVRQVPLHRINQKGDRE